MGKRLYYLYFIGHMNGNNILFFNVGKKSDFKTLKLQDTGNIPVYDLINSSNNPNNIPFFFSSRD